MRTFLISLFAVSLFAGCTVSPTATYDPVTGKWLIYADIVPNVQPAK